MSSNIPKNQQRFFQDFWPLESKINVAPVINVASRNFDKKNKFSPLKNVRTYVQPNLAIRNGLIRNKLVLRSHFQ